MFFIHFFLLSANYLEGLIIIIDRTSKVKNIKIPKVRVQSKNNNVICRDPMLKFSVRSSLIAVTEIVQ